jgi:flagellar motor switch protein FliG
VLNSEESKQQKIASESKLSQTEKNLQENKLTQTQTQTQKEETKSTQTSENDVKQNLSQNSSEKSDRVEHFERIEKVERVESGDAVQKELGRIKIFGLLFCAALIALLVFIAMAVLRAPAENRVILENLKKGGPASLSAFGGTEQGMNALESSSSSSKGNDETIGKRLEIQRLTEELLGIFIQNPKVTKIVFSNILMDDGIEVAAKYLKIFGEHVFLELLRDASIQREMNDLVAFYARATVEFDMDEELSLLRKLHSKTISGKITASVASSTLIFDFLSEMDANQVEELMRGESDDIKAIVLTQCDNQKRSRIFAQMDSASRMAVMAKLSHIDYLPKNYIYNVAMALKRKKTDNPKLNTESLPGSEVLLSLLETTGQDLQRAVVKNLELQNMDNTRVLMNKLVSIDTLRYLRDGQILEVILSLKHDELLFFLKGCGEEIRKKVFSKAPGDLVADLEEELESVKTVSKEAYQLVERKVINKIKVMSHEGQINLLETNERMFSEADRNASGFVNASAPGPQ